MKEKNFKEVTGITEQRADEISAWVDSLKDKEIQWLAYYILWLGNKEMINDMLKDIKERQENHETFK